MTRSPCQDGRKPLHTMAMFSLNGHVSVMEVLLHHQADVDTVDKVRYLIDFSRKFYTVHSFFTITFCCSKNGDTPLMRACSVDKYIAVKQLVSAGHIHHKNNVSCYLTE